MKPETHGEVLNKYTHEDPERHFIGESLPTPGVITSTGAATLGVSPISAREDHFHGIDPAATAAAVPNGAWTALPLGTNWANYGGGWQVAEYRKHGDMVVVRGLVASAAAHDSFPIIATVPHVPLANQIFVTARSNGSGSTIITRIDLYTNGTIQLAIGFAYTGTTPWVSLNSIVFYTT